MRIAICGSHVTGKSSLVSDLDGRLSGFTAIDEPYYLLEDEGHAFGAPPTVDDFELLLGRSIALLAERRSGHVLFDRCPADYLAYLMALSPETVSRDLAAEVERSMASLDLVVFVPIERPDRIGMAEAPRLRRKVDEILRDMLVDGGWEFDAPVVAVCGTPAARAYQVEARLARMVAHTT